MLLAYKSTAQFSEAIKAVTTFSLASGLKLNIYKRELVPVTSRSERRTSGIPVTRGWTTKVSSSLIRNFRFPWFCYREQHVCFMWFLMAPEGSWCPKGRKWLVPGLLPSVGRKPLSISQEMIDSQTLVPNLQQVHRLILVVIEVGKILSRIFLLTNKVRLGWKWNPVKTNFCCFWGSID